MGLQTTAFMISKPDGFPAGDYKVEISLNGQPVAGKDFSMKKQAASGDGLKQEGTRPPRPFRLCGPSAGGIEQGRFPLPGENATIGEFRER